MTRRRDIVALTDSEEVELIKAPKRKDNRNGRIRKHSKRAKHSHKYYTQLSIRWNHNKRDLIYWAAAAGITPHSLIRRLVSGHLGLPKEPVVPKVWQKNEAYYRSWNWSTWIQTRNFRVTFPKKLFTRLEYYARDHRWSNSRAVLELLGLRKRPR